MMKMRNLFVAMASTLAVTVTGCVAGPRFSGDIQFAPNAEIIVIRATAHPKSDGILIDGDVRRTNGYANAVPGHLEVIARDESGKVLATTETAWGEFMTRRFRLAYFTAFLRIADPSAIATIRIVPVTGPPH